MILGVGIVGLGVDIGSINWPLLLVSLPIGIVALEAIGLALAGITMAVARFAAAGVSEGSAGVLYLLSGAVSPPALLPNWPEPLSAVLPLTYWLEAARRALLPGYDPRVLGIGDPLLPLVLTTAGAIILGVVIFRLMDRRTRSLGRYDRTTEF